MSILNKLVRALSYCEPVSLTYASVIEDYKMDLVSLLLVDKQENKFAYISNQSSHIKLLFDNFFYKDIGEYLIKALNGRSSMILGLEKNSFDKELSNYALIPKYSLINKLVNGAYQDCDVYLLTSFLTDKEEFDLNDMIASKDIINYELNRLTKDFFFNVRRSNYLPWMPLKLSELDAKAWNHSSSEKISLLTEKEVKLLTLMMGGMTHQQISANCGLTKAQVSHTCYRLCRELNFHTPHALALYLVKRGVL